MKRRQVLSGCGAVLATTLAGCGGDSGSDGGSTPTETAGSTDTPMETPMETETMGTPTATETMGSDITHELGEQFTVGEGENAIQYTINNLYRTDTIGGTVNNETADGTYLLVVVTVSNPRSERFSFPRNRFRVRRPETWSYFNTAATEKIQADERINVSPIGDATILPGETVQGAVAFDIRPSGSYRLWIQPTGETTPNHYVDVGEISAVQEIRQSSVG